MQKAAVFGATGGVGAAVVDRLQADGIKVRALVREPTRMRSEKGVEAIVGDLADAAAIERTVAGTDAVIWTVGATRNSPEQVKLFEEAARSLVRAMDRHGVRRLVALSGAGITVQGERKPLSGRLMSAFVGIVVRHVVAAKRREYEIFLDSGLDWTLVRPPRVVAGAATGHAAVGDRLEGRTVSQGDLAAAMVELLNDRRYVHRAPYVSTAKSSHR